MLFGFSYDGQAYHLAAVYSLMDGWNPILQPYVDGHAYMLRNYPKIYWLWEAAAAKLLGQVETGKGFNLFFTAAASLAWPCINSWAGWA